MSQWNLFYSPFQQLYLSTSSVGSLTHSVGAMSRGGGLGNAMKKFVEERYNEFSSRYGQNISDILDFPIKLVFSPFTLAFDIAGSAPRGFGVPELISKLSGASVFVSPLFLLPFIKPQKSLLFAFPLYGSYPQPISRSQFRNLLGKFCNFVEAPLLGLWVLMEIINAFFSLLISGYLRKWRLKVNC